MSQRLSEERWGIFMVGPCGPEGHKFVVRAASWYEAALLVGYPNAPVERVGDALIDSFPRVIVESK